MFLNLSLSSSLVHLPSKTPVRSTLPHNSLWDQVHLLAVQSQEFLVEAYEKFVEKDFDNGGSKATAGLDLLLQRYISSS